MPDAIRPADPELRHNMLGMTETGSVCLMDPDESDQPEHRRGSFGRPVPGLDARVVDPDTLEDVAPGEVGELWFRGPFLMEGYYGRERAEVFTADGWYRTGDLFRVDDDGFFYFHGRRGDMIKTAGANVSPREVEAAIARGHRGLGALRRSGSPTPSAARSSAPSSSPNRTTPPISNRSARTCRARLSAYKVPRRFLVLGPDELPDAVERQARRRARSSSGSMSAERLDRPRAGAAPGRRAPRASRSWSPTTTSLTYAELDRRDRGGRGAVRGGGRRQGHPRRAADAQRHRVAGGRGRRVRAPAAPSCR